MVRLKAALLAAEPDSEQPKGDALEVCGSWAQNRASEALSASSSFAVRLPPSDRPIKNLFMTTWWRNESFKCNKKSIQSSQAFVLCGQSVCNASQRLLGDNVVGNVTPGKYVLDFGSVVVCQLKTKIVQLRNASTHGFSLKINKKVGRVFTFSLNAKIRRAGKFFGRL